MVLKIKDYGNPYSIRLDNGTDLTSEKFIEGANSKALFLCIFNLGIPIKKFY
jgi:hypothetical protein